MAEFLELLKGFGPFTTPLCFAMAFAVNWLIKDRQRLLDQLAASHEDAKQIRDKRTDDQKLAAAELKQYGEAMAHRMEAWGDKAQATLDSLGKR